jgi:hypothetical protein
MKNFLYKIFLISLSIILIYNLTIGPTISQLTKPIVKVTELLDNKSEREKIKIKILNEIKKANNKENYLSNEEAQILSNFINKLVNEMNLNNK